MIITIVVIVIIIIIGDYFQSIHFYQMAIDLDSRTGKAHGYLGSALLDWSRSQPKDVAVDMLIRYRYHYPPHHHYHHYYHHH